MLTPALQLLDQHMAALMPRLPADEQQPMLIALLREMMTVFQRVLLEGNPARTFEPGDADMCARDLKVCSIFTYAFNVCHLDAVDVTRLFCCSR